MTPFYSHNDSINLVSLRSLSDVLEVFHILRDTPGQLILASDPPLCL